MGKLTVLQVRNAPPGVHGDGKGLYLRVKPSGARSWILRVQFQGRRQDIGLGSDADLTLEEARKKAVHLRKVARQGKDARAERDREKRRIPTFREAVKLACEALSDDWTPKTRDAFLSTLTTYAVPSLGPYLVSEISTEQVIDALKPIWRAKPQQARKVRHRIMTVLAFSKAREWRTMPLPEGRVLRLGGLGEQPSSRHFAAMPYGELPAFFAIELAKAETPARLALLFTILTAARSGEVRRMQWDHVDRGRRLWVRPAQLMKSGNLHEITLSRAALAVLDRAADRYGDASYVFPSAKKGAPLSDASLSKILRMAGRPETVHGFRATFRSWAVAKQPETPWNVAEEALAHSVGSKTERAYARQDEPTAMRFRLLEAWGDFVAPQMGVGANV